MTAWLMTAHPVAGSSPARKQVWPSQVQVLARHHKRQNALPFAALGKSEGGTDLIAPLDEGAILL